MRIACLDGAAMLTEASLLWAVKSQDLTDSVLGFAALYDGGPLLRFAAKALAGYLAGSIPGHRRRFECVRCECELRL